LKKVASESHLAAYLVGLRALVQSHSREMVLAGAEVAEAVIEDLRPASRKLAVAPQNLLETT